MKRYMDIENLRDTEEKIGDIVREANTSAFEVGDLIQITEKYDGSNASVEITKEGLKCYSRNNELTPFKTLNGFYNYVQQLQFTEWTLKNLEGFVIFGEWSGARNKIIYDIKNDWFVFDIFDQKINAYLTQAQVKSFCEENHLTYIHTLYEGPFISWEHCKSFCHSPAYGTVQEGVVVKNQDKITTAKDCFYLKIVNSEFKEKMKRPEKIADPEKDAEKTNAETLIQTIVTRNRVEKILFKLRDEGIIGNSLAPQDMKTVAQHLPKKVFEDCLKEEPEIVTAAGEYAGKLCSSIAMRIAREIIVGK